MINLPDDFLSNKKGSKGGGVIQVILDTYINTFLIVQKSYKMHVKEVEKGFFFIVR